MLDQETASFPKLSYKLASSNCQDVLSRITFNSNKLECFPLQTVGKGEKRQDKGKGKEDCIVEDLGPSMRESHPLGLTCSRGMKTSKLQLSVLGRKAIR